jgi:hypothetical protein
MSQCVLCRCVCTLRKMEATRAKAKRRYTAVSPGRKRRKGRKRIEKEEGRKEERRKDEEKRKAGEEERRKKEHGVTSEG